MTSKTNVKVYMKNTTTASFADGSSWITDGLTMVYSGSLNCVNGWNWFELDMPFDYDGTNLLLVVDDGSGVYDGSTYYFYYSGGTNDPYRQIYWNHDGTHYTNTNVSGTTGSISNYRPNTKFCITAPCTHRSGTLSFATQSVSMLAGTTYTQAVSRTMEGTPVYSSSNTSIATVDNNGVVTAAAGAEGTVTITATLEATGNYCREVASYTIHVGDGCIQAGNGTSYSSYTPVYTYYSNYYSYSQQEYTAEEILVAGGCQGDITSIKFQYYGTENMSMPMQIFMGKTDNTPLGESWVTDASLTQVYNGTVAFTPGWVNINLSTAYPWDGVSNIVVAVQTRGYMTDDDYYFNYTSMSSPYMARYAYSSSSSGAVALGSNNVPSSATGTYSTYRPNMKFCIDCCEDNVSGNFSFDQTEVEYVIGSGAFTPPSYTNTTGLTSISYTSNNPDVGSVNTTTGAVSFEGVEGTLTVTAKLNNLTGCSKYAQYTIDVNDGCKKVGTGTSSDYQSPMYSLYAHSWTQQIYTGAEIGSGGTITRIGFNASSSYTTARTTKIYMALTDKNSFSSSTDFIPLSELTLVYDGSWNITQGWNYFNLITPFPVPCGKNVVVAMDDDVSSYSSAYFYYTYASNKVISAYSDTYDCPQADMSSYSGSKSLLSERANIKFCMNECVCPEMTLSSRSVRWCTNGTPIPPTFECASTGARTYSSSNTDVVTIGRTSGVINVIGTGTATITIDVAATGEYCAASASYDVQVFENCPTLHYSLANCTGTATPSSIPDLVGYGMVNISDVVPSCSTPGMVFAGWCTRQNGEGGYYQPGAQFPLYQDTTLYAIFYSKCCHPDSTSVSYIHQQVNWNSAGEYSVIEGATNPVTRSEDGYFYYDICKGENNNKVIVDVNLRDDCNYSNMQWAFEYADQTNTHYVNGTTHFEAEIDSVIGYGLSFSAYSSEGCWLHLYGRVRVSPGIEVANVDIPTFTICPGNVSPVTVGYPEHGEVYDIQVDHPGTHLESTLGHADKIYLPDGIACDVDGDGTSDCAYISTVNFTDFQNGAVVRSVEDILYVSLSIEHSFIGDIYIALKCPNGNIATILKKYTNSSPTDCGNSIPANAWRSSGATYAEFGVPDEDDDGTCDSTASGNAMGTPWTYAWSDNSTNGYVYAGGANGFVYEDANITSSTVDSSDLTNMTQIYHPDDSFENLVGCPLNGPWSIIVMDAWNYDNGYLVDWQLALSEDLAGKVWNYQVELDTATLACNWNMTKTHAGFVVEPPVSIQTGNYTCELSLFDEYGCVATSDVNLSFVVKELTVTSTATAASCGGNDGSIQVTATGGGDGVTYTYRMGSETNTTGLFTGLSAGNYTVNVTSSEGCEKMETVVVTTTGQMTLTLSGTTPEKCVGASNGSITVVGSEGTAPYTYTLNGETNNTGVFEGLAPGTYTVTSEDNMGCTGTLSNIVVAPADTLKVTLTLPTSGQCPLAAGSNYNLSSTVTGGTTPYTYQWGGDATGTNSTTTIASTGACRSYTVTLRVTDNKECYTVANGNFNVVDDELPVISTTATSQDLGCDPTVTAPTFTAIDNCLGTLTPTVTTTGVQGTGCAKSQTWRANVSDNCGNNATERIITYTWTESQVPTIGAIANQNAQMGNSGCKYKMIDLSTVTLAAASDPCGGTVEFVSQSVAVGTEYTQTNAQQTISVTVTVRGTCGKTNTATVNVIIPAKDITVDITNTGASVCAGGDTVLTATGSSSNGALTYAWTPTTGLNPTTGASVTATVSTETTYTVTATDPAGCTATDQITVTINPEVTLNVSNKTQTKCLGAAITDIDITVTNGTISNAAALQTALAAIGLTYNNGHISGTPSDFGTHTFEVVAVSNQTPQCSQQTETITLNITNLITPVISGNEDICVTASEQNTQLTLTETVGDNSFTCTWNVDGGTIVSGQGTNSIVAEWTGAGDKTVTVTLALDGCSADGTKTIHVRPAPVATITPVTGDVCPNAGTIEITGNTTTTNPNYTYNWGGGLTLDHNTVTVAATSDVVTATIPSNNCNTTYQVTLNVVDNYGCKNTATPITITVKDDQAPVASTYTLPDKDVDGCNYSQLATLYPAVTTVAALEAEATALGGSLTISDNCTTDKTQLTLSNTETYTGRCPIVVTRKYKVTDLCGKVSNEIVQTIRINVADAIDIAPATNALGVECVSEARADLITPPTVTDACGTTLLPLDGSPVVNNQVTNCNGTITYTYNYKDCAEHPAQWVYTYTVTHPNLTVPADSVSPIPCLSDTSNTFIPVALTDACGNTVTATLVGTPDMSGYNASTNTGDVVFNYQYTDCAGQTYPWTLTYEIVPSAFTETPSGASTVSCISQATLQEPAPRTVCGEPIVYVADPNNPIDAPADIDANDGCGTRTYRYTYNVNGTDYEWNYVYTIRPDSIVFEGNVATRDTVECDDPSFTPTLPTVTTNCGIDITSSATVTTGGTYDGCEGTKTWNYTFTDCTGRTRAWNFTRVIDRVTAPHQEGEVDTASTVECLASTMTPPATLPVVKDVCGNTLTAPTPRIDSTWNGCTGQKTYTYVYEDCAGLRYVWRYHYDIERTGEITEEGHAPTETVIHCINDTVRPAVMPVIKDICGNILQPRIAMPDPVISLTGCVGTVTYTYSYTDCAGKNYQWSYVNRIERSEKPHIVTAGGTPTTVDCQNMAVAESITLPVVADQCGVTLDAPVPVITNNWTTEPCNGTRTFTYNYTDCADSVLKWEYTYTISHPGLTVPTDSVSPIPCLSDTSNTFIPVALTDACGNTATAALEGAPDMSGYNASTNTGNVVFNYRYTDCAGQTYPWKLTYEVVPSAFTETPSGSSTVSCLSQAILQEPTPRTVCGEPIVYVPDANNPIDDPANIESNGGCGTRTYRYTYNVNGTDYVWNYVYTIRPDSIVFEGNVATRDTVECDDPAFTPTLPTVKTNCGIDITSSATVVTGGTYGGCEGTKTWTYTFSDCTGRTRNWTFTRFIDRVTPPHQEGEVDTAITVECLASTMTPPATLPVVKDVCGNTLAAPTPRIDSTWNGCTGQKTYTYVYEDCARLRYVWRYHYDIERTGGIHEVGNAPTETVIHCINDTVRPTVMPVIKDTCGNILQPRNAMPDPVVSLTGCVGTVTYNYSYTDCAGMNYQWSYVNRIERSEKPHIVTAGGTPRTVICQNLAVADSITLPVVADQCGVTLDAPVPVVTNNWTSEPCEGTRTFTYNYTDCADSVLKWEYTFTIDMPNMTMPGDSISPISCLADTSNTFVPVSLTDTCGNTVPAALVGAPDMSGYDDVNNTGDVVFNYQYTDCAGQTYPWKLTYRVVPDAFTETPSGASTVSCISQATLQEPAPRTVCGEPIVYVADPSNPIDAPADIDANGGCGTRTYRYTYNVNGTDYEWNYVYTIRPDSIVFEGNVATRDTVECDDPSFTPTLPTVKTNCGIDITSSATVVTGGTYVDCEGTKTWTYTFSDCTGRTRNWTFTRLIRRVTPPAQEGNVEDAQTVECLASTRVAPTVLPVVKDVCGNTLPAPQPVIDSTWDGCTGTKTYTYTYEDCAGLTYVWHYTYNIVRTGGIHEEGTAPTETVVHCINDTVRPTVMPVMKDTCGNILQPLNPMPAATVALTGCVGTVTFTYNYEDCAGQTYEWSYVNRIERSEKPHIVTAGGTPRSVICEGYAVADSITLPVIADQCGVTLDAPVPVITNDWNTEPCNGTRTFTYNYTDCADSVLTWTYTFTIDMPAPTIPANGGTTVQCYAEAQVVPTTPEVTDTCGRTLTVAAGTVDDAVVSGIGTVTYNFTYTDCEGNDWPWQYVYTVTPDPVPYPADEEINVYCAADALVAPTTPAITVCMAPVVFTLQGTTGDVTSGCGDYEYAYSYTLNNVDTVWRYTYHVRPGDFEVPAPGETQLQCYNGEIPTPPAVSNDSTCGNVSISAPVVDDSDYQVNGCTGDIVFTYTYSNCAHSHDWTYTYHIVRTTVPVANDMPTSSNVTCVDLADGTFTMPTVTDACGVAIANYSNEEITGNPVSCNGTKIYTYTYTDCAGLTMDWTYTYNINDNVQPSIDPIADVTAEPGVDPCTYQMPDLSSVVLAASRDNCSGVNWVSQSPAAGEVYTPQSNATNIPVVVRVADGCGREQNAIVNVIIPANDLVMPAISGVQYCEGGSATITAAATSSAGEPTYTWTPTTDMQGSGASVTVNPANTTSYTVVATDPVGCTVQRSVLITVNHPTNTALTQVVCEGYTWSNHGWSEEYNTSGTYTHDYTTAQGCASTDTLHLTVYHNTNTAFTETSCDSYMWENHTWSQTYTTSGNYTHSYTTADGCPSTDTLHLTINHNSSTTYSHTECDSYTWTNNDPGWSQTYTTSGTYSHGYTSAEGCPSTDVLTLTINYSHPSSVSATECDHYTWYGTNYTTSGEYTHMLQTTRGCDSLVTLYLTIINSYETTIYDTVCEGTVYSWYGNDYTTPGVYDHTLTSVDGCDSVLTLRLSNFPTVRVTISETHSCKTGSYILSAAAVNADTFIWSSDPEDEFMEGDGLAVETRPLTPTTYTVVAGMANHMECAKSDTIVLLPIKSPIAAIEAHPNYLTIDRLDWSASDRSSYADWIQWYVDGEYYSADRHINGIAEAGIDSLSLMLIAGTAECADTALLAIPYSNVGLWIPNAFTPNMDYNNFFGPEGVGITEFEMWVYNREGLLVFHSETIGDRWDGKHKGTKCPQGSYTYRILYRTVNDEESLLTKVGTVLLLR